MCGQVAAARQRRADHHHGLPLQGLPEDERQRFLADGDGPGAGLRGRQGETASRRAARGVELSTTARKCLNWLYTTPAGNALRQYPPDAVRHSALVHALHRNLRQRKAALGYDRRALRLQASIRRRTTTDS